MLNCPTLKMDLAMSQCMRINEAKDLDTAPREQLIACSFRQFSPLSWHLGQTSTVVPGLLRREACCNKIESLNRAGR